MTKETLRKDFEQACNNYVKELAKRWEWDISPKSQYGYWIADEVGGIYSYGEFIFISLLDIIYCVENDVSEEEYIAFQDYNRHCLEYNLHTMNLNAWHKNAPRVSQAQFDNLDALKCELFKMVEELRNKKF